MLFYIDKQNCPTIYLDVITTYVLLDCESNHKHNQKLFGMSLDLTLGGGAHI